MVIIFIIILVQQNAQVDIILIHLIILVKTVSVHVWHAQAKLIVLAANKDIGMGPNALYYAVLGPMEIILLKLVNYVIHHA